MLLAALGFTLLVLFSTHSAAVLANDDRVCRVSVAGKQYIGPVNVTASGRPCQAWGATSPRRHSYNKNAYFADGSVSDASNFCRNPGEATKDFRLMPWCYSANRGGPSWEYCDIPLCGVTECEAALGMESGEIKDSQISSSAIYSSSFPAKNARLNLAGTWIGQSYRGYGYLQVDLETIKKITKLAIQGSHTSGYPYRTNYFNILLSKDGIRLTLVENKDGTPAVYPGTFEMYQTTVYRFRQPLTARYVIIYPTTYYSRPALRLELYGCVTSEAPHTTNTSVTSNVQTDTVWDLARSPFLIDRPITVTLTATLRIQSGVDIVMMNDKAKLIIEGCIHVEGTADLKVTFQSSSVYSNLMNTGFWPGIEIKNAGCKATLKHVVISGAVVGITSFSNALLLDSVHVHHSQIGIRINSAVNSDVTIRNCQINDVKDRGLDVINCGNLSISDTVFRNFGSYGVFLKKDKRGDVVISVTHSKFQVGGYAMRSDNIYDSHIILNKNAISNTNYGLLIQNHFYRNKFSLSISENQLSSNNYQNIYIYFSYETQGTLIVDRNVIKGGRQGMIVNLKSVDTSVFTNNVVEGVTNSGVNIQRFMSSFIFTGNRLTNCYNSLIVNGPSDLLIKDNVLNHNRGQYVVYANNDIKSLNCTNNTIVNNTASVTFQSAITSGVATINENVFDNKAANHELAISSAWATMRTVDAKRNYWGTSNPTLIQGRVHDFFTDCYKSEALLSPAYSSSDLTPGDFVEIDQTISEYDVLSGGRLVTSLELAGLNGSFLLGRTLHVTAGTTLVVEGSQVITVNAKASRCIVVEGSLQISQMALSPTESGSSWNGFSFVGASESSLTNCSVSGARYGIHLMRGSNVTVRHTNIYKSNYGVRFDAKQGGRLVLDGCELNNQQSSGTGLSIEGGSSIGTYSYIHVSNSQIVNNQDAIKMGNLYGADVTFSSVSIHSNRQYNIHGSTLYDCNVLLERCNVKATSQHGVYLYLGSSNEQNIRLYDCTFEHSGQYTYALYISTYRPTTNIDIRRSSFTSTHTRYQAVYIYTSDSKTRLYLEGNSFTAANKLVLKLDVYEAEKAIIKNNIFRKSGQALDFRSRSSYFTGSNNAIQITNNTVANNSGTAPIFKIELSSRYLASVPITHNRFINNTGDTVLFLRNFRTAIITDNHFDNPKASFNLKVDHSYVEGKAIRAERNWWGTNAYSGVIDKIYDYNTQSSTMRVSFMPFITSLADNSIGGSEVPFSIGTHTLGGVLPDDFIINGTYHIIKDVTVPKGKTLTIAAGSELLFNKVAGLVVEGQLICSGTPDDKIVLRPEEDNEHWKGIEFRQRRSDLVRLRGSSDGYSGLVEVYSEGNWYKVCSDYQWDNDNANVLCHQLGYRRSGNTAIRSSSGVQYEDKLRFYCSGSESALQECSQYIVRCRYNAHVVCQKLKVAETQDEIVYLESKSFVQHFLSYNENYEPRLASSGKRFWLVRPGLVGGENTVSLQSFEEPGWYLTTGQDGGLTLDFSEKPTQKNFLQHASFLLPRNETDSGFISFESNALTDEYVYINSTDNIHLAKIPENAEYAERLLFRPIPVPRKTRRKRQAENPPERSLENNVQSSQTSNSSHDNNDEDATVPESVLTHTSMIKVRGGVTVTGRAPLIDHVTITDSTGVGITLGGLLDHDVIISNTLINKTTSNGIHISPLNVKVLPSSVSINNVTLIGNQNALRFNGHKQNLSISDSTFVSSRSVSLHIRRQSTTVAGTQVDVTGCDFKSNQNGAVDVERSGDVRFIRSTFIDNRRTTVSLRGYYQDISRYTISDCVFRLNSDLSRYYYTLYVYSRYTRLKQVTISNNIFEENEHGHVIYVDGANSNQCQISQNKIRNNVIKYQSAVDITSSYSTTLTHNTLVNPSARYEVELPNFDSSKSEMVLVGNYWGVNATEYILPRVSGFYTDMSKALFTIWPFRIGFAGSDEDFISDADYFTRSGLGGEIKGMADFTSDYRVTRSIFVRQGGRLTIGEGVNLYFSANTGIYVQGGFDLNGGVEGITMGPSQSGKKWYGIVVHPKTAKDLNSTDDTTNLINMKVIEATNGLNLRGSAISIRNISVTQTDNNCVAFYSKGSVEITDSVFTNCGTAMYIKAELTLRLDNTEIRNSRYGINNEQRSTISMRQTLISKTTYGIRDYYNAVWDIQESTFTELYQPMHIRATMMKLKNITVYGSTYPVYLQLNSIYGNLVISDSTFRLGNNQLELYVQYSNFKVTIERNTFEFAQSTPLKISGDYSTGVKKVTISENSFIRSKKSCLILYNMYQVDTVIEKNQFLSNEHADGTVAVTVTSLGYAQRKPFLLYANEFTENSGKYAVSVDGTNDYQNNNYTIRSNVFLRNALTRTVVYTDTPWIVVNNNIFTNDRSPRDVEVSFGNGYGMDATDNWWGSKDESDVKSRIFDKEDSATLGEVLYKPFLTKPDISCSNVANCSNHGLCIRPDVCDCISGWRGDSCSEFSCVGVQECLGRGSCAGPNTCKCNDGWLPPACVYASCAARENCNEHGACVAPDTCRCFKQYSGDNCSDCADGHWGSKSQGCFRCPDCVNGKCNKGTGTCDCFTSNWAGELCNQCSARKYGPRCLPLVKILKLAPTSGPDVGGTAVRVYGHNFVKTSRYRCSFDGTIVNGTWVSDEEIVCISPRHKAAEVHVEISPSSDKPFTSDQVTFTYTEVCPSSACGSRFTPPRGICSFGTCICSSKWTGNDCDVIGIAPRISRQLDITTVEFKPFSLQLTVSEGSSRIDWSLNTAAPGMSIDKLTGLLEWQIAKASSAPYRIQIAASNTFGEDRAFFQLHVPPTYSLQLDPVPSGPFAQAQSVLLTGRAEFTSSETQAEHPVPVNVLIRTARATRTLRLTTIGQRHVFYGRFYPGSSEVGRFHVDVRHPADARFVPKATWSVYGMTLTPATKSINEYIGTYSYSMALRVTNTGVDSLSEITLKVPDNLPFSLEISKSLDKDSVCPPGKECVLVKTLESGKYIDLDMSIKVEKAVKGAFSVEVVNGEGMRRRATVNFAFPAKLPEFTLTPSALSGSITRGQTKYFQVRVENTGLRAATRVQADLPQLSSMRMLSFRKSGDDDDVTELVLAPKESAVLILGVTPRVDEQLGEIRGSLAIKARETQSSLSFRFVVSSSSFLNLTIGVEDEFTYFSSEKPLLSGAKISLTSKFERTNVIKTTGENGFLTFENIREGYYEVRTSAPKHLGDSRVILATPGMKMPRIFLQRTAVRYSWSVTPVDFEDRYEVNLEADFEVDVPMPVVTIEPRKLDMEFLQAGHISTINFKLTNHGWIRAEDVKFTLPDVNEHPFMRLEMGVDSIGNIEANTTIIVPVKVMISQMDKKRYLEQHGSLRSKRSIKKIACVAMKLYAIYTYYCDRKRYQEIGVHVDNIHRALCRGTPGGGGGGGRLPLSWSGYSTHDLTPGSSRGPVPVTSSVSCEQILDCLKSAYDCYKDRKDTVRKGRKCLQSIKNLFKIYKIRHPIYSLIVIAVKCYKFYKSLGPCIDTFKNCDFGSGASGSKRAAAVATKNDLAPVLATRLIALSKYYDLGAISIGDESWADMNAETWFESSVLPFVSDNSEGGKLITQEEFEKIKEYPLPANATAAMRQKLIERMNSTTYNWDRGVLTGDNIISYNDYKAINDDINDATTKAKKEGFESVLDWYEDADQKFEKAPEKKDKGVCAKVRIRLAQRLTLTRAAFSARLELENGEARALEHIRVRIHIKAHDDQVDARDRFAIGKAKLEGLSGVDGTGRLDINQDGAAEWLIVPYQSAAPERDIRYDIGGTLVYGVGGENLTVPLFPDTITVKPDPRLHLRYFLKKFIQSDDPFTKEIEPSVPFSLGILIANSGYGTAKNLKITSAQPEIIENEKGLLVDFQIIGTQLGDKSVTPSLTLTFGDIKSRTSAVARWLMTSSLQGKFSNYSATFENINPLGDPELSLMESVEFHELLHVVRVDAPEPEYGGRDDGLHDFLTINPASYDGGFPCCIYLSHDALNPLNVSAHNGSTAQYHANKHDVKVIVPSSNKGWNYYRVEYTAETTNLTLHEVKRNDGKKLLANVNAWVDKIDDQFFLHVLDYFDTEATRFRRSTSGSSSSTANAISHSYEVVFVRANRYRPIFSNHTFEFNVPESSSVGVVVANGLLATDRDHAQSLTYKLDKSTVFSLDGTTGKLSLVTELDREKTDEYILVVTASDDGMPSKTATATIQINVMDANDNTPKFDVDSLDLRVEHSASIGFRITTISASDADSGNNAKLSFNFKDSTDLPFSIDSSSGILTVSKPLAAKNTVYNFKVVCSDHGTPPKSSEIAAKVTVNYENRSPPVFDRLLYNTSVSEAILARSNVLSIRATDQDEGDAGKVTYEIASTGLPFEVDMDSGNLITIKQLDREKVSSYKFEVIASDQGAPPTGKRSATCTVKITIIDVNDNSPRFAKDEYDWDITENASPDNDLLRICATDQDFGNNRLLTYSLRSAAEFNVKTIENCAMVKPVNSLDREKEASYTLSLFASDQGVPPLTSSVVVKVSVIDVNDNPPKFKDQSVSISVSKYTPVNSVIFTATATDDDIAGKTTYSISGSFSESLSINQDTGAIRLQRSLQSLVASEHTVVVAASDSVHTSNMMLKVMITSENKAPPVFRETSYAASVPESMPVTSSAILTVSANDADSPDVSYVIADGNVGNIFHISQSDGKITLLGSLDYETRSSYDLSVVAVDSGDDGANKLSATVSVSISVLDVNEFPPVFTAGSRIISVSENIPPSVIAKVVAKDEKESHSIVYKLASPSSLFAIGASSGSLSLKSELDREKTESHILTVIATDSGSPAMSASVTLTVQVKDVNDNDPTFSPSPEEIVMSQANISSSLVLLKFHANDLDAGINGEVRYSLLDDLQLMNIDPVSGVLSCKEMCRGVQITRTLQVVVIAKDNGIPSRQSRRNITVIIYVEKADDTTTEQYISTKDEVVSSTQTLSESTSDTELKSTGKYTTSSERTTKDGLTNTPTTLVFTTTMDKDTFSTEKPQTVTTTDEQKHSTTETHTSATTLQSNKTKGTTDVVDMSTLTTSSSTTTTITTTTTEAAAKTTTTIAVAAATTKSSTATPKTTEESTAVQTTTSTTLANPVSPIVRGVVRLLTQFKEVYNDVNDPITKNFLQTIIKSLEAVLKVLKNFEKVFILSIKPGSVQIVYAVQFSEPVQEEKLVAETIKTAVVANDHSLAGIQVDTSSIRILPKPCTDFVCHNEGVCESEDGISSKCKCPDSYEGATCETPSSQTLSLPLLIGCVVGLACLVVCMVFLIRCLCRQKSR